MLVIVFVMLGRTECRTNQTPMCGLLTFRIDDAFMIPSNGDGDSITTVATSITTRVVFLFLLLLLLFLLLLYRRRRRRRDRTSMDSFRYVREFCVTTVDLTPLEFELFHGSPHDVEKMLTSVQEPTYDAIDRVPDGHDHTCLPIHHLVHSPLTWYPVTDD